MDALYIVLLFMALLIPGFILGKLKLLQDGAAVSLSNILMYVAMPFLVFVKLLDINFRAIGWLPIAVSAILPILLSFLLPLIGKYLCRAEDGKKRAAIFCAAFPNCGFLGIPLAAAMFPEKPEIILYISIFNVVSTFLLLTLGIYILSGDKRKIDLKKTLISPICIAMLLGIIASLCHVKAHAPYVYSFSETLAQLCTPLSMIALGYELSKMQPLNMWKSLDVYAVALIRLLLSPLFAFLILLLLKFGLHLNVDSSLAFAMMIATAVSTAASAPAMTKKYELDSEYTAALTLVNTLLFTLTLPLTYLAFNAVF